MKENYLSKEVKQYFTILYKLETETDVLLDGWFGRVVRGLHVYFMLIKYLLLKKEKVKFDFNFEELLNYYNLLTKENCLSVFDKVSFLSFFETLNYDLENGKFLEKVDFNFNNKYFSCIKKYLSYLEDCHVNYLEKVIKNENNKKEYISPELINLIKNKPENTHKDLNLIELYLYVYKYNLLKNNYQIIEQCESFKYFLLELQNMVSEKILNENENQCIETFLNYVGFCNEFNLKKLIEYNQKSIIYLEEEEINNIAALYFKNTVMETKKMLLESNLIIDYLIIEENMKNF